MDFTDLNLVLSQWPSDLALNAVAENPIIDRIRQILMSMKGQSATLRWHGDLQPLIRHCLLYESRRAGRSVHLRVPASATWPSAASWHTYGVKTVSAANETAYVLTAEPWFPIWLDCPEEGAFHDAFAGDKVRQQDECPADPFITDATGFTRYSSVGQREAVRAAFLLRPGHTLLVNLPTGSGKSLVGQAPTLVHRQDGPLSIVVVPTVALALDQETAMLKYLKRGAGAGRLAWVSDLTTEERAQVRARIRNGTQRILITSPEALSTSLLSVVTEASKNGMLAYFVIDEAHLVTQWGVDFRPTFQALAGLRNNLLRVAPTPFRTLLLSATFTEETADTLANLFGPPETAHMVSAVHLRPEPQYWVYKAASRAEKERYVLEALRHAPRPFILYVTTREDASRWTKLLREGAGLGRMASFDGGTAGKQREEVIKQWRANALDGIVATSAFGVGVDKGDVRTIIHAAIPETLDRFYQEVGRGGRDGRPSVSLVVYDDSDWELPGRLSQPKIVSEEIGFGRWEAMYETRKPTDEDGLWHIDIDARRKGLHAGNEYNVSWNVRTLSLMARAGLLALDIEPSDSAAGDEANASGSLLAARASFRVRILHQGHRIKEVWENRVATARDKTRTAGEMNLSLMRRLVGGKEEVADILAELYRIGLPQWPVWVTRACGGCSQHRQGDALRHYPAPIPIPLAEVDRADFQAWERLFPWLDPAFVYVFYDEAASTTNNAIVNLVRWLVGTCNVREVAVEAGSPVAHHAEWRQLYRQSPGKAVLHRDLLEFDSEPYTPLARVTVVPADIASDLFDSLRFLQRSHHLIFLPRNFPDPANSSRRLADVCMNGAFLEQLVDEISR
jgi:superfamily II DNA/RNA helicase